MAPKKIAVVLFYEGGDWIARLLTSLKNQTCGLDQIVILDDRSTEAEGRRLERAVTGVGNVSIQRNDANLGPHRSVMRFLSSYTDEAHIYLCDQDDEWLRTRVEVVEERLAMKPDSLVVTNAWIEEHGRRRGSVLSGTPGGFWRLLGRNKIPGCLMSFHSAMIPLFFPFPEAVFYDHWIALVCAMRGRARISVIDEPQLVYVRHEGTLTRLGRRRSVARILLDRMRLVRGLGWYLLAHARPGRGRRGLEIRALTDSGRQGRWSGR